MKSGNFSKIVVGWYLDNQRPLPWRLTRDPYKIWLSEIILQQTRVNQGLPYYQSILASYPTVRALADARLSEVLRLWQGLGYYSRARHLHRCAKVITDQYDGVFPGSFDQLKELPGIGDYTAAAIASMAFNQSVAVVDGNVYRVLSRYFGIEDDVSSSAGRKLFQKYANDLIAGNDPATYNQAVMEFGALHCVPKNPKCEECPLMKSCQAFRNSTQSVLPVKIRKTKIRNRYFSWFLIRKKGKIYMRERKDNDIWKGLYDLPILETRRRENPVKAIKKMFGADSKGLLATRKSYKHLLTHQHLYISVIEIAWPMTKNIPYSISSFNGKWYAPKNVVDLPKPVLLVQDFQNRGIL